jgi:hypothetical protein
MFSRGITDKMVLSQATSSQDIRALGAKSFIATSETIEAISLGLEADSQQPNVTVSIGSCRMETKAD